MNTDFEILTVRHTSTNEIFRKNETVGLKQVHGEQYKIISFVVTGQLMSVNLGNNGFAFLDHLIKIISNE